MTTNPQKPASAKPVSIRIDPETRALLDYVIERTGLKDAQILRRGLRLLVEQERALAAARPKPARKTR
jgi:predicted DNA-binding protein